MRYQIGTSEPNDCVGSRAANSDNLDAALMECLDYSKSRHVTLAWLREWDSEGKLGEAIAFFKDGRMVEE